VALVNPPKARVVVRPLRVAACPCGRGDATHEVLVRTDDARSDDQIYYRCEPCARSLRAALERAVDVAREGF
jgi:hypothetical protein